MTDGDDSINNISQIYSAQLKDSEFKKLSEFIMSEYGIKMPPEKRIMLQSRLQKRLKALGLTNFKDYLNYLFSPQGIEHEVVQMMDVVSTNKTDFFRESAHFDYLNSDALPHLTNELKINKIEIWSAGCSSGEEPYTLAITLKEYSESVPGFDFNIFASDISTKVLKMASNAIYHEDRVKDIPFNLKKKYFLRSKNREDKQVRVIPELRKKMQFARINLLELPYSSTPSYHIIFCRNVLIYFDRETQQKILNALCSNLITNGFLFLGHSESISGYDLPVKSIRPTIFSKI